MRNHQKSEVEISKKYYSIREEQPTGFLPIYRVGRENDYNYCTVVVIIFSAHPV